MPGKKRAASGKGAAKKRPMNKFNRKRAAGALYNRPVLPGTLSWAPQRKKVFMRYVETFALAAPTSGAVSYTQFHANSIYTPQVAVATHQPLGYDTWSGMYEHYKVVASDIRVTFMVDGNMAVPCNAGILPQSAVVAPPILPSAKMEAADPRSYAVLPEEASERKREAICTSSYDSSSIYSAGRGQQDGLIANFGSNPQEVFVWTVWWQNAVDSTTPTSDVTAFVEIGYEVDCLEPKLQQGD